MLCPASIAMSLGWKAPAPLYSVPIVPIEAFAASIGCKTLAGLGQVAGYEVEESNSNVHFMIAEGDVVVMEFDAAFTTFEGEPYHNEYCLVFVVREFETLVPRDDATLAAALVLSTAALAVLNQSYQLEALSHAALLCGLGAWIGLARSFPGHRVATWADFGAAWVAQLSLSFFLAFLLSVTVIVA